MQMPINFPDPPKLDEEKLKSITKVNMKEFKDTYAYKKYCLPYVKQAKKEKLRRVKKIVFEYCLPLISLCIGAITLLIAILDYILK